MLRDVRELLKDWRRLEREKRRRTRAGRRVFGESCRPSCGFAAEEGDVGVWKLSAVVSLLLSDDMVVSAGRCFSGSGVGGKAPGMEFVGCEERGPPPGVGGRWSNAGVIGGESGGGGMLVPEVKE